MSANFESPLNEEMGEIRRNQQATSKLAKQMARQTIDKAVTQFIQIVGRDKVERKRLVIEQSIRGYNDLFESTVRLSIPTIDAMTVAIGFLPGVLGLDLLTNPKFLEIQTMFQAIKKLLVEERDAKLAKSYPQSPDAQAPIA